MTAFAFTWFVLAFIFTVMSFWLEREAKKYRNEAKRYEESAIKSYRIAEETHAKGVAEFQKARKLYDELTETFDHLNLLDREK